MFLQKLTISTLRNITQAKLHFSSTVNCFIGVNGSGKSTLLESIYLLARGQSFRATSAAQYIQTNAPTSSFVGRLVSEYDSLATPTTIGIEKRQPPKEMEARLNGERQTTMWAIARCFPVQLLNQRTYHLIKAAPSERRKMMNWGMFHVKHAFADTWQRFSRVLMQRNATLKKGYSRSQVAVWNDEFIATSVVLQEMRDSLFASWAPQFTLLAEQFFSHDVRLVSVQGWPQGKTLEEALLASAEREAYKGYTLYGPQRADFSVMVDGVPAQHFFSLGQQKLVSVILVCSLLKVLQTLSGEKVNLLLDDFAADLDEGVRRDLLQLILDTEAQSFVTGTSDAWMLQALCGRSAKMFHVEHGVFST